MGINGLEICILIFAAFVKGIEAKYYYYYYTSYYTYYYISPGTIGGAVGGTIFGVAILIGLIVSCCRRRRANPGVIVANTQGVSVVSNGNQAYSPGYYPGTAPQAQYPGMAPQYPGAAPQYPGAAPQYPGAAPQYPGAAPQNPGVALQQYPGTAPQPGFTVPPPEYKAN